VLRSAADHIIDNWASGEEVRWYFGGGEPTLNPDFEPFIEHLSNRGQWVMLVTNGSQGPSYWAKNADHYNTLIFSAHFEFMKSELFAKNYQRVVEVMLAGSKKLNDFIVKLMTKPGQLQHSIDFVGQLKEQINFDQLPPQIKSRLKFDMVPLRRLDNGSQMLDYSQDELDTIINFNSQK
jgi:organic radical activating enzyme